jgi:hypothetical protein
MCADYLLEKKIQVDCLFCTGMIVYFLFALSIEISKNKVFISFIFSYF